MCYKDEFLLRICSPAESRGWSVCCVDAAPGIKCACTYAVEWVPVEFSVFPGALTLAASHSSQHFPGIKIDTCVASVEPRKEINYSSQTTKIHLSEFICTATSLVLAVCHVKVSPRQQIERGKSWAEKWHGERESKQDLFRLVSLEVDLQRNRCENNYSSRGNFSAETNKIKCAGALFAFVIHQSSVPPRIQLWMTNVQFCTRCCARLKQFTAKNNYSW